MMPSINPQDLQKVQEFSKHITGEIRVDYSDCSVKLTLKTNNEQSKIIIPNLLSQFSENLATQMSSFFAIDGEIVEVNKE